MDRELNTAMVLAAGYGTRLGLLTSDTPKALVKVKGIPMLENVINKLISSGIQDITVNAHHFPKQIVSFFQNKKFDAEINIIIEQNILGTGGGIKNASDYLNKCCDFLVYNVDIESDLDIQEMHNFHKSNDAFATLALQNRVTSRPLIVDSQMNIIGRKSKDKLLKYRNSVGAEKLIGFCGVHIISSKIFDNFLETSFFDIFTTYFRLISQGEKIIGYDIGTKIWKDLGTMENLLN
jgi:NDP-sugar pyrophosphorylase family protein